ALRDGRRYVARLARCARQPSAPPSFEGTWLVTGGLGALGHHVARRLVTHGVTHLVLTGRRGLDTPGAALLVTELEARGVTVRVAAADLRMRSEVERLIAAPGAELPPLRGIVHAAGLSTTAALAETTPDDLGRAFSGKADGAWWLHQLTRHLSLDAFILFSS